MAAPIGDILACRFGRRDLLKGGLAAGVIAAMSDPKMAAMAAPASDTAFDFAEAITTPTYGHILASDHELDVVLRWGDPVVAGAPAFDPQRQSAEAQAMQFGYNNDFLGYFPLPRGSASSTRGLLCVNHEFTNEELMFPGLGRQDRKAAFAGMTRALVEIEMAAHGGSVVEVERDSQRQWAPVADSAYNRRITAHTKMAISGPAAGHDRLKTSQDPKGRTVFGTLNNCAGGQTPWGTYLMAEENINYYFLGRLPEGHREAHNYKRFGLPANGQVWGRYHDRFDLAKEPNEANRFGWVVEVDPYDPASTPVKRTALGRFKHEGCETIVNPPDRRLVVYMGDDQRFDYVYRFVTAKPVFDDASANRSLLDDGTLSVARFDADGTLTWLPLIFGEGPLTPANGFRSQADVLIEARRAGDLLGATPMDRPEDVQPNAKSGTVYVMLTNNSKRPAGREDAANPRPSNIYGHILELKPPGGDHGADRFRWDPLVLCGPKGKDGSNWSAMTSAEGWFAAPDNCAVDDRGRLWVASDQGGLARKTKRVDGVWALDTQGAARRTAKRLFGAPVGAEVCGPKFTPDGETLFVAIQHPAAGVRRDPVTGKKVKGSYDDPATRWPETDLNATMPPRPSVVAIRRKGGGKVGG
ncbi:MAG: PhoX family protein [Hyphomicrobiales bacterium]